MNNTHKTAVIRNINWKYIHRRTRIISVFIRITNIGAQDYYWAVSGPFIKFLENHAVPCIRNGNVPNHNIGVTRGQADFRVGQTGFSDDLLFRGRQHARYSTDEARIARNQEQSNRPPQLCGAAYVHLVQERCRSFFQSHSKPFGFSALARYQLKA